MAKTAQTSETAVRFERAPLCIACGKNHPTAAQRRNRGEMLTDYERTCILALQEGISHAEAAA